MESSRMLPNFGCGWSCFEKEVWQSVHPWLPWTDFRRPASLMARESVSPLMDRLSCCWWQVRQYCVVVSLSFWVGTFLMEWEPWQSEQGGAFALVMAF